MNKAELFARYDNYGNDIIEIASQHYFTEHSEKNRDNIRHYYNGNVECYSIVLDGVTLMWYSCTHNVGWHGDVESHQFFCKIHTMTKAEIDELANLFC
jgi:hypothetical protein